MEWMDWEWEVGDAALIDTGLSLSLSLALALTRGLKDNGR